ncbi:MAG: metalloregulator ArsR/SmtB family transcription factor [Cyanobacteria bacterium P01_D01_bin.50]
MTSNQAAQYADMFAALGSEPRLEVMRLLFAAYPEGMTVGEIQEKVQIPNSTLSHHLEKLRNERLVIRRKQRQFLYYSANAETMQDLLSFLSTQKALTKPDTSVNKTSVEEEEEFMPDNLLRFFHSIYTNLFGPFWNRFYLKGYDRFTDRAINAIHFAQLESRRLKHNFIGSEQILLGVLYENDGIGRQFLNNVGVNLENAKVEVEKIIGKGKETTLVDLPFTPRAQRVLKLAVEESQQLATDSVSTEHLLLGILNEGGGVAVRVLQNLQVDLIEFEQHLRNAVS